ncbi:copper chaperone PCu(A)C [soil metagenome]
MNVSRTTTRLTLGLLMILLTACGGAAATGGGEITVSDARVPVPAGANGAAYMTLTNDGDSSDQLVGASSEIAGTVELHESSMADGSMSMQQVDGIEIPSGGYATLEPGGFHVMLIGVTEDLAEGDTVDLTLTFENAGEHTVSAEVVPLGDVPTTEAGSEGHEMGSEHMDMSSES